MASFVKLDENNIVIQGVVVANEDITDENGVEQESLGQAFLNNIYGETAKWKQTSYNANFRGNFAGLGHKYYPEQDIFMEPKPFDSWVMNTAEATWIAPSAMPSDLPFGGYWDEENQTWSSPE